MKSKSLSSKKLTELREKLKQNVETVSSQKGNNKKFLEQRVRLYNLLTDHPHFKISVDRIRSNYGLSENGLKNDQQVLIWENNLGKRYHSFIKEVEILVNDFEIPHALWSSLSLYIIDYIVLSKQINKEKDSVGGYPLFSIVQTDANRDINKYLINRNSLYLEIFEWTTERDIYLAVKKITKLKKDGFAFGISKVDTLARYIWLLSNQSLSVNDIQKKIKEDYKGRFLNYSDIGVYKKRYKDALQSLRKF